MIIKKNDEVLKKIRMAGFRGASVLEKKPLYVEQNAFDVDLDMPIYRIAPIEYVLADIEARKLTHTRIGEYVWGDPSENPLAQQVYVDEVTGEGISLKSLVDNMFAVCWSTQPNASQEMWTYFSYGKPSVRLQSTPRKLLSAAMDDGNPYFMLQHFIGRVEYRPLEEVESYFSTRHYTDHLDSLGQGLALSVMMMPDDAEKEEEVRLVYAPTSTADEWTRLNVECIGDFVRIPFDWRNVLEHVILGASLQPGDRSSIEFQLRKLGVECPLD